MPTEDADDTGPRTVQMMSLREDVLVESGGPGDVLTVVAPWGEQNITDAAPQTVAALQRMTLGPVTVANVFGTAVPDDREAAMNPNVANLRRVLELLAPSVVHSLGLLDGLGPVLSVMPRTGCLFAPLLVAQDDVLRLSRFSTIRPVGGELVVESPRALFRVVLHRSPALEVVSALRTSRSAAEVAAETGLDHSILSELLGYLAAAGVVSSRRPTESHAEDIEPEAHGWTFQELAFHVHNRAHRRHPELDDARLEAIRPTHHPRTGPAQDPAGERIVLPRPWGDGPRSGAPSAPPSDHGLRIEDLAAVLLRGMRTRSAGRSRATREGHERPGLELYVAVNRCRGLGRAVYRYGSHEHDLVPLPVNQAGVDELFAAPAVASGTGHPAALLIMTMRMARMRPILGGTVYSSTLVHTGGLHEALRRVGYEVGVNVRLIAVDDELIDRVLGLSFPTEVAVGECALDLRPRED